MAALQSWHVEIVCIATTDVAFVVICRIDRVKDQAICWKLFIVLDFDYITWL